MKLSGGVRKQKLKTKICAFPDCGVEFKGRGKSKYCDEHKKPEYKKYLYQNNTTNGIGDSNVRIDHKNVETLKMIRTCDLEGCGCEYEIIVIPNQYIYPKYCEVHRNEFKRKLFTERQINGKEER